MVNLNKRVIVVKRLDRLVKNIFSQNGHIGKNSILVIMVKESLHIGNSELWKQARLDIKAKSIKPNDIYLCHVHYMWYMHVIA